MHDLPHSQARLSRYDNGVTVATWSMPHCHSVAFGFWLYNGSRHDPIQYPGLAHLYEHLLFAAITDNAASKTMLEHSGAKLNAQTGRELTVLYGQCPAPEAGPLIHALAQSLIQITFETCATQREVEIALQESHWYADLADEYIADKVLQTVWSKHDLGKPILGRPDTLRNIKMQFLHNYHLGVLSGSRLHIVAVGNISQAQIVQACTPLRRLLHTHRPPMSPPRYQVSEHYYRCAGSELANSVWFFPLPATRRDALYLPVVAQWLLAGSPQNAALTALREQGFGYALHSRLEQLSDCGYLLLTAPSTNRHWAKCQATLNQIIQLSIEMGFSAQQLESAKRTLQAELIMQQDDLQQCMERMGREIAYFGSCIPLAEHRQQLNGVQLDVLGRYLQHMWKNHSRLGWHSRIE